MDYVEIVSFHAGMNRRVSPLLNKLEEARVSKNTNLEEIGTLKKDRGYSLFLNQPTTGNVLSIIPFYKIGATTTRYFLRDSDGLVYSANIGGGTWDAITGATGLSSSIIPMWATYKNVAMRFNGSDNPKKYDGTTFADLGGSPTNGSIVTIYKDRVYVSGASPNYSTIYYSEVGQTETWPSFNNFDVNINDGDRVIAMMPLFDSLIIFKEFSIWEFQVDAKNNPSTLRYVTLDVGTTSVRSIINIGGIAYFFNRRGIYQFASQYPELISLKIQPFIDAITDPYSVVAFADGNKYCLYVGTVTVDGRTFTNCTIIYDTLQDAWTIKAMPDPIKCASSFILSDNSLAVYLGTTLGKTLKWRDGWSYNGTPIEMEHETGIIDLPDPDKDKMFKRISVRSSNYPKSPVIVQYSIDGGYYKTPKGGGMINSIHCKFDIRERGRDISIRIHENSAKEMREVYKVRVGYETIGEELEKHKP